MSYPNARDLGEKGEISARTVQALSAASRWRRI